MVIQKPKRASTQFMAAFPQLVADLVVRGRCDDTALMRELGWILMSVHRGEPANILFRQDQRKKPKQDHFNLAFVYWYVRATSTDVSDDTAAMNVVTAAKRLAGPKAKSTVKKIAQKYRRKVFETMSGKGRAALGEVAFFCLGLPIHGDLESTFNEFRQLIPHDAEPAGVARLAEYLRRKSPRRG